MNNTEELLKAIDKLKISNKLIIVEGDKDKRALNELGLDNIITLKGALYKVTELVDATEVIILTDLDKEGKRLYHKLKNGLDRRGIKINNYLRGLLFKSHLRQIEGLSNYLRRLGYKYEKGKD